MKEKYQRFAIWITICIAFFILVLCYWHIDSRQIYQSSNVFSLFVENKDVFAPLKPYEVSMQCSENDKLENKLGDDKFSTNKADIVISRIRLVSKTPAYFDENKKQIIYNSDLVDECGLIYSSAEKQKEAKSSKLNCQNRQSRPRGVIGTGSFAYTYGITVKNIGTQPAYNVTVDYNKVTTTGYWDFGFKPWDDSKDRFAYSCDDPIFQMAHNDSISDFAQEICTKTFCDRLEVRIPRANYCILLANLISMKSAYDDIKNYIISSSVYKNQENKRELDVYLSNLQNSINAAFSPCFSANSKYSPKSREDLGVQNWVCSSYGVGLNITGANILLANIALDINRFRDSDMAGTYTGVPIFDKIDLKPVYKTPDLDKQKVISVINSGNEEEVLFTIFPPRLNQGQICQPDTGFWSVNTTSDEITKNNNYDIASNGRNCESYMEVCDFSYSHSSFLSGKGKEGQMWKGTNAFPGLLDSYTDFGYCGDPPQIRYYSYQLPTHGRDFCNDHLTLVAPKASLPGFACAYYW